MGNKKKYRFGLVILLGLLFTLLFSTFSISYASQPTLEEMTNFVDLIKIKQASGELVSTSPITGNSSQIATEFLALTTNVDFSINNVVYFPSIYYIRYNGSQYVNNNPQGCFMIANGGFGSDVLNNLYFEYNNNGSAGYTIVFKSDNPTQPTFYTINNSSVTKRDKAFILYSSSANSSATFNTALSLYNNNFIFTKLKTFSVYVLRSGSYIPLLNNFNGITYDEYFIPPEPPEPENTTGIITNSSGDVTGAIDLSGLENGLINIQNQISGDTQKVIENQNQNTDKIVNALSGETQKITNTLTEDADELIDNTIITSGDIESALNFEIAQDPYSNFWFTLTNNLKSALLGTKRSIDISFQGRTWTISLDEYLTLPVWLVIILTPFSTAFFTWVLVRQFKLIFDKLSSGNIDFLLKENSEERYF